MVQNRMAFRPHRPAVAEARQQRGVDPGREGPQWPVYLMLLGLFSFLFIFFSLGQLTLVTFTDLFRWFALFAFAGNLFPQRLYGKRLGMDRLEWFWFNLLAIGPLLLGGCLVVNFFFHGPEQRMLVRGGASLDLHRYWREQEALPPHLPWPSDFGADPRKDRAALATARAGDAVFGLAEGSLGYFVIMARMELNEAVLPAP